MLATSNSDTIVQYRSAQKSVMTRIFPRPAASLIFAIERNFSTMGRTLPGLQYMISRIGGMAPPPGGTPFDRSLEQRVAENLNPEVGPVDAAGVRSGPVPLACL